MSQPAKPALRALSKPSGFLPRTQTRHESTARRHRKLLHVQQSPSYAPSTRAPTLIFNPPSSAPSVYHTPLKFLPPNDARKKMYEAALTSSTLTALARKQSPIAQAGTPLSTESYLPPKPSAALPKAVRSPYEKKYHLTEADVEEIRRLRKEDPVQWTRVRLAEKFGCSQFFVGMVAKNEEAAERVAREHDEARMRWGSRRRLAREDRVRRKESWGRDA